MASRPPGSNGRKNSTNQLEGGREGSVRASVSTGTSHSKVHEGLERQLSGSLPEDGVQFPTPIGQITPICDSPRGSGYMQVKHSLTHTK